MTKKMVAGLAIVISTSAAQIANATLMYEFDGIIPNGAVVTLPGVSVGDAWTAIVVVDDTVVDSDSADLTFGDYEGAALSATLSFSSGFWTSFAAGNVIVADDYSGLADAVQANFNFPDGAEQLVVQTDTNDLNALSSDGLPMAGTSFASSPHVTGLNYFQLKYYGPSGNVEYYGDTENNTLFRATAAVAEPSTAGLLTIGSLGLGLLRRRRRTP